MADNVVAPPRRRRGRRWLLVLSTVVVALLLFVFLLPTFVSWGLGQQYIRNAIDENINGTVDIDKMSLGWFSDQSIEGFAINDAAGQPAARLNIAVDRGLFSLMAGRSAVIVTLTGSLNGEIREDGSLSFVDLIAPKTPGTRSRAPRPPEPFRLPELPPAAIKLDGVTINLLDRRSNEKYVLDKLNGALTYTAPAEPIAVELHGKTMAGSTAGSVDLTAQAADLFDADRAFALRGASAKVDLNASSIPLPVAWPAADAHAAPGPSFVRAMSFNLASDDLAGKIVATLQVEAQIQSDQPTAVQADISVSDVLTTSGEFSLRGGSASVNLQLQRLPIVGAPDVRGQVQALAATIISDDLTQQIAIGIEGSTQIEGHQPSPLTANFTLDQVLAPGGNPQFGLDKVTGSASGRTIPSALLQPALAKTPIDALRDIGPTVDLQASFSQGASKTIELVASGERARLELTAKADPANPTAALSGSRLLLDAPAAHPDLIRGYTQLEVARPTDVRIELTSFSLPAVNDKGERPKGAYAATGTLASKGPMDLRLPATEGDPIPLAVRDVALEVSSPALADHLNLRGSLNVDGAEIQIDQKISNLIDASGAIAASAAMPAGTLSINGLPPTTLAKFAPEQRERIAHMVGDSLSATVKTSPHEANLTIEAHAKAAGLDARINALRKPDMISVMGGEIGLVVSPELAASFQQASAEPVVLAEPAAARLDLQPLDIVQKPDGGFALADQPIRATLTLDQVAIKSGPQIVEPVAVRELVTELRMQAEGSQQAFAANGDIALFRSSNDQVITRARYRVTARKPLEAEGPWAAKMDVGLGDFSLAELEEVLGKPSGTYSQWLGPRDGSLRLRAEGSGQTYTATISADLANLKGEFQAATDGANLWLDAANSTLTLSRQALEARLNPEPAPGQATAADEDPPERGPVSDPDASRIRVAADVPVSLTIPEIRVPLGLVKDEPFDPAAVSIDLKLTGGPLTLVNPSGAITTLSELDMTVTSGNLATGVSFALKSKAGADAPSAAATQPSDSLPPPKPGSVDVTGTLASLMGADSKLHPEAATLQMKANAREVPTAVADGLGNMKGLLVAALGPQMNAVFDAKDFSRNTGQLEGRVTTSNGWLETQLKGRNESFRATKNKPTLAELEITPPLRERLLEKIHPILADIRTTEQPLRIQVAYAVVPTDANVKNLKADIEITVGKVELDSGSRTLSLLRFFGEAEQRKTIPGEIEPIIAKIRNGIVKYDKFAVRIDKYTLNYSGEINLAKQTIDVRTEIPLEALGQSIRELEPYADKIVVPLVTRGKFGEHKTTIDPDFDIGKAALDAGFRGGLHDLLRGKDGKGLLDDLLKDLGGK